MRGRQLLPRGWGDFLFQLSLWFGFILAYQIARGIADRGPLEAFQNGRFVIDAEQALHTNIEADLQRVITQGDVLVHAVNVTYWLSQFPVLGLAMLWIYLFRNDVFPRIRNWVLATNMLARMYPEDGFVDTLASSSVLNHGSGLIQLASNPYAAMPSVHAADALIVGFAMAMLVRSRFMRVAWTLWPSWVWFSVMATGNHFWLDIAAGVGLVVVAGTWVAWIESKREDEVAEPAWTSKRW